MKYVATRRYWSSLCIHYGTGPLDRGTAVDLEPLVADAFNRDSPGILEPADKPRAPSTAPEPEETRDVRAPEHHRQVVTAPARRADAPPRPKG